MHPLGRDPGEREFVVSTKGKMNTENKKTTKKGRYYNFM
jgi:hypothetical protein